jgi:MoaA/NifB/PqqE/SkfB family radical SAM enzyme
MNKSTFCILPFRHLYADPDGEIRPCCVSNPIESNNITLKNTEIKDVYNIESFKKLRLDLVNGVKNTACNVCWDREKSGVDSMRIFSNKKYGYDYRMESDGHVEPDFIDIDVRFSNLCNFKCIMCGHWLSSAHWGDEERKKGIPKVLKIKDNIVEELIPYVKNLKHIYFGGGEPLIMEEHFEMLKFLHKSNKNITIKYTTNLSVIKHDILDLIKLWKDFKNVHLQISVDGLFEKGEKIRVGFDTQKFLDNIQILQDNNIFYTLSYTTGSHNIFDIYEFIENVINLKIVDSENKIELHNYVTSPDKFSLTKMMDDDKLNATQYLLSKVDNLETSFLRNQIYNLVKFLGVKKTNKIL